jgi:hypothetical protein
VNAEGKFVDICTLATEVEDTNLRIGYTTIESRFWIWLQRLAELFRSHGRISGEKASTRCDLNAMMPASPLECGSGPVE